MAYAIDTAAAISDIEEAGAEPAVARAIVRTVASAGDELVSKPDLAMLKSELKEDIAAVKEDIAAVKADVVSVKADIVAVKAELKEDIAAVKADVVSVKTELKEDIAAVRADGVSVKADIDTLKADVARLPLLLTVRIFVSQVGVLAAAAMLLFAAQRLGAG